jgi:hypothetical protein
MLITFDLLFTYWLYIWFILFMIIILFNKYTNFKNIDKIIEYINPFYPLFITFILTIFIVCYVLYVKRINIFKTNINVFIKLLLILILIKLLPLYITYKFDKNYIYNCSILLILFVIYYSYLDRLNYNIPFIYETTITNIMNNNDTPLIGLIYK